MSASETKLNFVVQIQFRFALDPALREIEGRLVVVLGRALIKAGEIGKRRNLFSVSPRNPDWSVGQAQRKGRVRIIARAFDARNALSRFRHRPAAWFLPAPQDFACFPRRRIDDPRELDHRIVRGGHGGGASFVELLAEREIFQLCSLDQLGGAGGGRFAGQNFLHQRIAVAESRRAKSVSESVKHRLLESSWTGSVEKRSSSSDSAIAVAEFREAFAVWFRAFSIARAQADRAYLNSVL